MSNKSRRKLKKKIQINSQNKKMKKEFLFVKCDNQLDICLRRSNKDGRIAQKCLTLSYAVTGIDFWMKKTFSYVEYLRHVKKENRDDYYYVQKLSKIRDSKNYCDIEVREIQRRMHFRDQKGYFVPLTKMLSDQRVRELLCHSLLEKRYFVCNPNQIHSEAMVINRSKTYFR